MLQGEILESEHTAIIQKSSQLATEVMDMDMVVTDMDTVVVVMEEVMVEVGAVMSEEVGAQSLLL
jgi:hypothetical protein